jgi:hypothetical protein
MKRASEATAERLKGLCVRVEQWRAHREGGRSPVPQELWDAAVAAARIEGVHATSKALRFNYYSLKNRLVAADGGALGEKKAGGPTFVEMQIPSLPLDCPRESSVDGQAVIELVGASGARMRIHVTGTSRVDVVGLAQAFWSRES